MNEPTERKITCYSESESGFMRQSQAWRGRWLRRLLPGLERLRCRPGHLTLLSLLAGLVFCPVFLLGSKVIALGLLLLHVLLDGLDGPLARHLGRASNRGSFTGTMADQVVVTFPTPTLIHAGFAGLWPGAMYLFFYTVVVCNLCLVLSVSNGALEQRCSNQMNRSRSFPSPRRARCGPMGATLGFLLGAGVARAAPFAIQGPGVNPDDFRLTTFASGLSHPIGMVELADGSLLVAVSQGSSFWNSSGTLIRLVDADKDGVADVPGSVLYSGLPGGQTSLRIGGSLIFVTGQGAGKPITILRAGPTPGDPLTRLGAININYPSGGWLHPHSALATRESPGRPGSFDLLFQLGSRANFARTTVTATLSGDAIPGASGILEGDSIYQLTIDDPPAGVTASNLTRIARGLRNPAGFAFEPGTGDLYFEDNGIDGLVDANEPTSADELNRIAAADIGVSGEDFGFPDNYTAYRSETRVGGAGIQPLIAFQPLPDPQTGSESEGPNDITFAPRAFPPGLNRGIFVGFHGRFGAGGLANEENPLVYADPIAGLYFHFVSNDEAGVGHLDGLLATADSLFIADIAPKGDLGSSGGTGVIYQLKSLVPPILTFRRITNTIELTWEFGALQAADGLSETWHDVREAVSPHMIQLDRGSAIYRVRN